MDKYHLRLNTLSGDAVMRHRPEYYDHLYVFDRGFEQLMKVSDNATKNYLKLLLRQEVERLSQDPDLMSELTVINDLKGERYGVLEYLLDVNPEKGMIYGARYGLKNLFHAAKRAYFKKHKFKNWKQADDTFKIFIGRIFRNAIQGGDVEIFKSCLKYFDSSNFDFLKKDVFVDVALQLDRQKIMEHLVVNEGASLEKALLYATKYDRIKAVEWLIEKCYLDATTDVSYYLKFGIVGTIVYNNYDLFKTYMRYQKDIDLALPLLEAVKKDRLKMIEYLLECGAQDVDGACLRQAVYDEKIEVAKLLLSYQTYNHQQATISHVLGVAIEKNHYDIFLLCMQYAEYIDLKYALLEAVCRTHLSMVEELLKHGAQDVDGDCLTEAVHRRKVEILTLLLKYQRYEYEQVFDALRFCILDRTTDDTAIIIAMAEPLFDYILPLKHMDVKHRRLLSRFTYDAVSDYVNSRLGI